MTTNIVMLVKDRMRLTSQAIDSLYLHTPISDFNLTVIDDDSAPPTALVVQSKLRGVGNAVVVRIVGSKGITGQARNLGVYWSERFFGRGDFLYLSDNDVYFTDGWLGKMTEALRYGEMLDPEIRLLGGSNHPYLLANKAYETGGYVMHSHDAIAGYTHLMRWVTWDQFGPHDAHTPGTSQSEDHKFCRQIDAADGLVASLDPEVVYACGLTNTAGQPATGADVMKRYPGVIQE